jgi:uncharacterized membrane protein
VPCEGEALAGQSADVLLHESWEASLIVVGNRGGGGFASRGLGSVSQQVVHHDPSRVPSVTVPSRRGPAAVQRRQSAYGPLAWRFVAVLALVLALLAPLLLVGLAPFAYGWVGIGARAAFLLLLCSLLGSWLNLPVVRLAPERLIYERIVVAFGTYWKVPVLERTQGPLVAVNVGGALIPTGVSLWILVHHHNWRQALVATALVAFAVHLVARPVRGLGIVVPALLPPVIAAASALLLAGANPAPVAYVAGTLGTLIGADLLNLYRVRGLGAPVVSIGGAGTFDGIYFAGIAAIIFAVAW